MVNIKQISRLADDYDGRIKSAQAHQTQKIIVEMIGLVKGAVVSMQHLLSLSKYKDHESFQILLNGFQDILHTLIAMNQSNDPTPYLSTINNDLGTVSFYTSSGNAGIGRDALTDLRIGGYTAPSYYVSNLSKLYDTLNRSIFTGAAT